MSEPDTADADLARRVMEAAGKATEGPWTYADSAPASFGTAWVNSPDVHNLAACDGTRRSPTHGFSLVMKDGENEANAAFIALSRTAAPALAQAVLADRAEIERLREANGILGGLIFWPGESVPEHMDRIAEMFRRDTGYLAPFKDAPPDYAGPTEEELRQTYNDWLAAQWAKARTALKDKTNG